jgi:hypothetical protein
VSASSSGRRWDHNAGIVLAVLGGLLLVKKLGILQHLLQLWPIALIALGWQMYRRADEGARPQAADDLD